MAAGDWNFLAGRLVGDGTIDVIETELPIEITAIDRVVSAPSSMNGTISTAIRRLKKNGRPILEPWNSVIIAEASGIIRGMTIYRKPTFTGSKWSLDQVGLPGYALGMPYTGERVYTNTDPLDLFREAWRHLQDQPNGNLGLTVDDLQSPVRVGTPVVDNDNDSGPRVMNWWETLDLGKFIDDYARETPFDWLETFSWEGDQPHCHLKLGYPIIGGRNEQLRLVLGENLATDPSISEADAINELHVLGAGEGRDRVRGYAGVTDGRLRRVKVVDDKSRSTVDQANSRARNEMELYRGQFVVEQLEVFDHPNAPLELIEPGTELALYAETDWVELDQYVRVVGKSESPVRSDQATLTVVRGVTA